MPKKLIIVESPTKSRTLKKYLGNEYEVMASGGHVRDLPTDKLAVQIDKKFKQTGMSKRQFVQWLLDTKSEPSWFTLTIRGKRNISFWLAMRVANRLGIDLGKIQRKCKRI